MSINILDVDVSNIQKAKFQAMKEHIISVLDRVKDMVETGDYDGLDKAVFWSPSGDCMGSDNHCINFAWHDNKYMDISEAVEILKRLHTDLGMTDNCF